MPGMDLEFNDAHLDKLLAVIQEKERLSRLSNEELVSETLLTDAAEDLRVTEMMNRLHPTWPDEDPA